MPKISLCLIARDEERLIRGALESVHGVVDEMIVVDTGSTDRTRQVAEAAGALVVEHFWQDDFSAARNAALAHVTGDWVLVLDADERLAPGALTAIRDGVEKDSFDCGLLPLFNASRMDASIAEVLEGEAQLGEPVLLPRLFRRSLDLRWEGVVHENVATWLAGEKTIAMLEAPIVHYGATVEVRSARDKDRRNLRLLERRCALEPTDSVARTYLVRELLRAEEGERAHHEVERAWSDLLTALETMEDESLLPSVVTTTSLRTYLLLTQGRAEDAVETLRIARSWGETHPNFDLLLGNALLAALGPRPAREELSEIDEVLQAALSKRGRVYVEEVLPGATSYAARTELGTVYLLRGDFEQALQCFDQALNENSKHEAAVLGRLETLVYFGEYDTVLKELDPFLTERCVDAWAIAALVCARLARRTDAAAMISTVRTLPGRCIGAHREHLIQRLSAEIHARNLLDQIESVGTSQGHTDAQEAVRFGEDAFLLGAIEDAQGLFVEALEIDVGLVAAWTNLGVTLHAMGEHDQAASALQVALALEPDAVDARLNLAQVMYALERPHAATECLRGVLQRRPDDQMALELLCLMGVAGVDEPLNEEAPVLSVILRVCETDTLERSLDWIALQDLPSDAFHVLLACENSIEDVESVVDTGRPFELDVCEGIETALACSEGRWVLLLDPGALPAADCFRLHLEAHQNMGRAAAIVGAVELAVDSRTTPIIEVLASTSLLDDPMGLMSLTQPRGGSGSCNYSVPREVLESVDSDEIWRGGLQIAVAEGAGLKSIEEPSIRVYRELELDMETFQAHCFQLGYNHFRLGCFYEQPALLRSLVGADPADEENWMLLRARLERQRDTIRALWREASLVERVPLPMGERRIELVQQLHGRLRRIGAHAYEVGQAVAATGINPATMWTPSSLRTEMTSIVLLNETAYPSVVQCVESLRDTINGPVELIVVEMGSDDASVQWLQQQPDISLIVLPEVPPAVARNRGLAIARGRTVLFADSTVVFTPYWREILLEHLEQWPDIGIVAPVSINGSNAQRVAKTEQEGGRLSDVAQNFFASRRGQHVYVPQIEPSMFMVKMDMVERVGGFDVAFGATGLDFVDWCHRMRLSGARLRVARDCILFWEQHQAMEIDSEAPGWIYMKEKWHLGDEEPSGFTLQSEWLQRDLFNDARAFVPYQSDEELEEIINREPRLLTSRQLGRKSA